MISYKCSLSAIMFRQISRNFLQIDEISVFLILFVQQRIKKSFYATKKLALPALIVRTDD